MQRASTRGGELEMPRRGPLVQIDSKSDSHTEKGVILKGRLSHFIRLLIPQAPTSASDSRSLHLPNDHLHQEFIPRELELLQLGFDGRGNLLGPPSRLILIVLLTLEGGHEHGGDQVLHHTRVQTAGKDGGGEQTETTRNATCQTENE